MVLRTDTTDDGAAGTFDVDYTVTDPNGTTEEDTATVSAEEGFTSEAFPRGSTVALEEVRPEDSAAVTWSDPVYSELSFTEGEAPSVEGAQWSGVSFEPSTLMIGIGLLLMGAVVIGGAGIIWQHQAPTADAPVDLEGNAVSLAPEDTPSEEVVTQMDVEPGAEDEDGLVVPSVDHAVPLGTLSAVDGEITPPGFTEAYWVRNLGVPVDEAEDGTVYLVTHSVQDGYAPGSTGRSRRTTRNVQPMQKIDISAKIPTLVKSCAVELSGVGAASMAAP